MKTYEGKTWICLACGYHMDSASPVREEAAPKENDRSFCAHCSALYVMHSDEWTPITPKEEAEHTEDEKNMIARCRKLLTEKTINLLEIQRKTMGKPN